MSTECQAGASHTFKLSHTVMQQHMTHYCGPQIMVVNINSQGIKEPQRLGKAVIHSTVKALLLSAPMWGGVSMQVLYFSPNLLHPSVKPEIFRVPGRCFPGHRDFGVKTGIVLGQWSVFNCLNQRTL